jgi:hypothetical protein
MLMDRRDFLKGAAVIGVGSSAPGRLNLDAWTGAPLSSAPTLAELGSIELGHRYTDLFNLPIAMNESGYAQAAKSVSGITAIAFPPFACCGIPDVTWSPGFISTCEMYFDGKLLSTIGAPDDTVHYRWLPHQVERRQSVRGLSIRTSMFLPGRCRAVAQSITLKNETSAAMSARISLDLRAAVTKKSDAWFAQLPGEGDNQILAVPDKARITFVSRKTGAASAQGVSLAPTRIVAQRMLEFDLQFSPGEARTILYVNAIGASTAAANELHDQLQSRFGALLRENESAFQKHLGSAFQINNEEFSGNLPKLQTEDEALWNLYQNGVRNLLTARRVSPDSTYGPTYLTLSGHVLPTLSFPWDTSLTSLSLALLDPEPLRNLIEVWFQEDMHAHLATDYVTGKAVGPWYGVNDMAIVRCARDYLRITGNFGWLDKRIGDKTVMEHLTDHSLHWKQLKGGIPGLGDYGKIENILEVVSTYLHQIAGMNAGNVDSMRVVAELLEHRGNSRLARELRSEALELAERINQTLYLDGKGWWRCGQPDGSFNEVRHCYDFLAVLDNISADLSARQKQEMASYFWEQLATDKWMRALSSGDPDATWNPRTDHSCLGAYAAWPPMCAKGLYKIDNSDRAVPWLRQLSKAGNQGPIGQAHFAEQVFPPVEGAAAKAPNDQPYQEDWCCIAGGAFTDLVIDTLFGVTPTLFNGLQAAPRLGGFDPNSKLIGLRYQGKSYDVSRNGVSLSR